MAPFIVIIVLLIVLAVRLVAFRQVRMGSSEARRSTGRVDDTTAGYAPIFFAGAGDGTTRGDGDAGRSSSDSSPTVDATPASGGDSGGWSAGDGGGSSGGNDGGGGGS